MEAYRITLTDGTTRTGTLGGITQEGSLPVLWLLDEARTRATIIPLGSVALIEEV